MRIITVPLADRVAVEVVRHERAGSPPTEALRPAVQISFIRGPNANLEKRMALSFAEAAHLVELLAQAIRHHLAG